jgi:hypothetical protein
MTLTKRSKKMRSSSHKTRIDFVVLAVGMCWKALACRHMAETKFNIQGNEEGEAEHMEC